MSAGMRWNQLTLGNADTRRSHSAQASNIAIVGLR
jgi:hypothetical protein